VEYDIANITTSDAELQPLLCGKSRFLIYVGWQRRRISVGNSYRRHVGGIHCCRSI